MLRLVLVIVIEGKAGIEHEQEHEHDYEEGASYPALSSASRKALRCAANALASNESKTFTSSKS